MSNVIRENSMVTITLTMSQRDLGIFLCRILPCSECPKRSELCRIPQTEYRNSKARLGNILHQNHTFISKVLAKSAESSGVGVCSGTLCFNDDSSVSFNLTMRPEDLGALFCFMQPCNSCPANSRQPESSTCNVLAHTQHIRDNLRVVVLSQGREVARQLLRQL